MIVVNFISYPYPLLPYTAAFRPFAFMSICSPLYPLSVFLPYYLSIFSKLPTESRTICRHVFHSVFSLGCVVHMFTCLVHRLLNVLSTTPCIKQRILQPLSTLDVCCYSVLLCALHLRLVGLWLFCIVVSSLVSVFCKAGKRVWASSEYGVSITFTTAEERSGEERVIWTCFSLSFEDRSWSNPVAMTISKRIRFLWSLLTAHSFYVNVSLQKFLVHRLTSSS